MNSLVGVNINWTVFSVAACLALLIPGINIVSYIAILITLHQFLLLFYAVGYGIPIRYLFGSLMCLQILLGPTLAYNIDLVKGQMKIPAEEYFTYAIPAVICFIIGLHISCKKLEGEFLEEKKIVEFITGNRNLPFLFIVIGFLSSFLSGMFSATFAFVFYLLGGMKFIGVFMIIIGSRKLKPILLIIVYGSVIASSLNNAMFHDLVIWLIFLGLMFAIKYKTSVYLKAAMSIVFIFFAIILQELKKDYRTATWQEGQSTGIETLSNVYEDNQSKGGFLNSKSLAEQIVRINQGYIVTNIMKNVPAVVPYSNGTELGQILTAAFLPRFLAPDKLTAGNQEIFKKYSGIPLRQGTSMGLSSVGDAYINFGVFGGCIFMFLLGLFYSEVLKIFYKYGKIFPILLIFTPLVFYYPIRPDCELQTILGHLVKSCFLIFVIFLLWKKYFIVYTQSAEKDIHSDSLVPSSL